MLSKLNNVNYTNGILKGPIEVKSMTIFASQ